MFQRLLTPKTANEGQFLRFIATGADVSTVAAVDGHDQQQKPVEEIFNEDAAASPLARRKSVLEKQEGAAIWIQSVARGNRARGAILDRQLLRGIMLDADPHPSFEETPYGARRVFENRLDVIRAPDSSRLVQGGFDRSSPTEMAEGSPLTQAEQGVNLFSAQVMKGLYCFELTSRATTNQARRKEASPLVIPEGIKLGFMLGVYQVPPPVRHVKPFSKLHVSDRWGHLPNCPDQKVTDYHVERAAAMTGAGGTPRFLDRMLTARSLDLVFKRGKYDPPYSQQFVIGDSILAYDPQDLLNCRFESVRSEQLGPENDSDSQVLTFAKNCDTDEYTRRAGRTKGDMLMHVGNFRLVVSLKFRMSSCMIHLRCRSTVLHTLTPPHP